MNQIGVLRLTRTYTDINRHDEKLDAPFHATALGRKIKEIWVCAKAAVDEKLTGYFRPIALCAS
jgi:hypothetical protein